MKFVFYSNLCRIDTRLPSKFVDFFFHVFMWCNSWKSCSVNHDGSYWMTLWPCSGMCFAHSHRNNWMLRIISNSKIFMATTKFSEHEAATFLAILPYLIVWSRKLNSRTRKLSRFFSLDFFFLSSVADAYPQYVMIPHVERIKRPPNGPLEQISVTSMHNDNVVRTHFDILFTARKVNWWIDFWIWIKRTQSNANSVQ